MDEILIFFSVNKDALTSIGIMLTFGVSVLSLYFSAKNNAEIHYIDTITKNRTEWIYKFRDLVAEYIAAVNVYENIFYTSNSDEDMEKSGKQLAHARELCSKIKLMLNFTDEIDRKIIGIIENLMVTFTIYYDAAYECEVSKEGFFIETESMIKYSRIIENETLELTKWVQIYLKAEWNRVKYESQGKKYEKKTQEFDIFELEQKYLDPTYKNQIWKRFYINTKEKIKRIWNSSGFAIPIIVSMILIISCVIIK